MDPLSVEALGHLAAVLGSLLPPVADPDLRPTVQVHPRRIRPTGLGGLAGPHDDSEGEVLGRRLEATALVTVRAEDADALAGAVTAVTHALLAADRPTLRGQGILRIELEALGPRPEAGAAAEREVVFTVLYEFLKRPEAAGDLIQTIPIHLDLDPGVEP